MREILVLAHDNDDDYPVLVEPNLVKISGTVKDGSDTLAERTILIYKSGTGEYVAETTSNASDGKFSLIFQGEVAEKLRVVCLAKKGETDERGAIFDFVTAKQFTELL